MEQQRRRLDALEGVQRGLGKLCGLPSAAAVMDAAVRELCLHCGFSRALLFRIADARLVLERIHIEEGRELEETIREIARTNLPELDHLLIETEMYRRRQAMLVLDPRNDERTHKPLVEATGTDGYVAAPVQPQGTVIGFIHADRYGQGQGVDEVDRDTLWAFAEGFGFALERATLREQLAHQRDEIERLMAATKTVLDEVYAADVALDRASGEREAVARYTDLVAPRDSRLGALLTRRELEVVELMGEGATNATIASRLVISESTVKSHVKHVMRKLRASNRAEAVSRYHRLRAAEPD